MPEPHTFRRRTALRLAAAGSIALAGFATRPLSAAAATTDEERRRYENAATYSRQRSGDAVVIVRGGETAYTEGQNGSRTDAPHPLASGTKSFCGMMAAAAVADGLLDLDAPVAGVLTEWQGDARKARITARHLLTLTSGLRATSPELEPGMRGRTTPDFHAAALVLPTVAEPGSRFAYGPSAFFVFGELMKRLLAPTGETPLDYLRRRILDPIGAGGVGWRTDGAGNPDLAAGASVPAAEWAKVGVLLRDGGAWNGAQILRPDLVAQATTGTDTNPAYGLTFWLNAPGGQGPADNPRLPDGPDGLILDGGPPDLFMAAGAGLQRLYIVPSQSLVIVRQGRSDVRYRDSAFVRLVLGP